MHQKRPCHKFPHSKVFHKFPFQLIPDPGNLSLQLFLYKPESEVRRLQHLWWCLKQRRMHPVRILCLPVQHRLQCQVQVQQLPILQHVRSRLQLWKRQLCLFRNRLPEPEASANRPITTPTNADVITQLHHGLPPQDRSISVCPMKPMSPPLQPDHTLLQEVQVPRTEDWCLCSGPD